MEFSNNNTSIMRFLFNINLLSIHLCINLWQCRKKVAVVSISSRQLHNRLKVSWKLCLNLRFRRWLKDILSLVKNLTPSGLWALNINCKLRNNEELYHVLLAIFINDLEQILHVSLVILFVVLGKHLLQNYLNQNFFGHFVLKV